MTDTFIAIANHDLGMKCNHKACRITFVDAGLTDDQSSRDVKRGHRE
jgi:hypothetical protein